MGVNVEYLGTIIEQIQKTAQKILRFVLHPRTKRIQNFKSVVLWRTHLCRISNLLIYSWEESDITVGDLCKVF